MPWLIYIIISVASSNDIFIGPLLCENSGNLSYHKHTSKLHCSSVAFVCHFSHIPSPPSHKKRNKNGISHLGTHLCNGHTRSTNIIVQTLKLIVKTNTYLQSLDITANQYGDADGYIQDLEVIYICFT